MVTAQQHQASFVAPHIRCQVGEYAWCFLRRPFQQRNQLLNLSRAVQPGKAAIMIENIFKNRVAQNQLLQLFSALQRPAWATAALHNKGIGCSIVLKKPV